VTRWLRTALYASALAAAALLALQGMRARGASRDTAFYPVSSHELSLYAAPPLVFEKQFEATVAGTPAADPLEGPARDGDPVIVRTTQGTYVIDARTGEVRETRPPESSTATVAAGVSCSPPGGPPRWIRHLPGGASKYGCVPGPGGLIAVVGRDGSIFGRELRGGHLFWRRTAAHRISRAPLNLGPYLVVSPDASRDLQALRWSDGTPAGVFRLDSEDAYLVSAPVQSGDHLYVLAVESPRPETRLIALIPRQQLAEAGGAAVAAPAPSSPASPAPAPESPRMY
jgi:hypothetical protein